MKKIVSLSKVTWVTIRFFARPLHFTSQGIGYCLTAYLAGSRTDKKANYYIQKTMMCGKMLAWLLLYSWSDSVTQYPSEGRQPTAHPVSPVNAAATPLGSIPRCIELVSTFHRQFRLHWLNHALLI